MRKLWALVLAPLLGVLAWMGQVGPQQAVANYAEWISKIPNVTAPEWMQTGAVDVAGSYLFAALAVASLAWYFWPKAARARPKLTAALSAIAELYAEGQ